MPTRRTSVSEHRGEPHPPADRDDPPPPAAPARGRPVGWPAGTTIRVPDDAYRFGEGPLTLRVTEVLSVGPFEGRLWAEVRGHQVNADGTLRPRERFASIRVDRVRVIATDTPQVRVADRHGAVHQPGTTDRLGTNQSGATDQPGTADRPGVADRLGPADQPGTADRLGTDQSGAAADRVGSAGPAAR